jgi:hypothetical protein
MAEHDEPVQKFGAGHLKGMARQGLKEISQALPAFPHSGIQPVEELGVVGNPSPQEVVMDKLPDALEWDQQLDGFAAQAPEPERQAELER